MKHGDSHGGATVLASCDFETYSEAGYYWNGFSWKSVQAGKPGIKSVGAWVYSAHPSTEVLSFCYDLKNGEGPHLWYPGLPNPQDLFDHVARLGLLEAFNSFFEYCIWTNVCTRLYGWPPINLMQLRDVSAKTAAWALPRSLEEVAVALGTLVQKNKEGTLVMRKVSKPRTPSKLDARQRYTRENAPEEFAILDCYCQTDVAAEDAVALATTDLSVEELSTFLVDQRINARGVQCDLESVSASIDLICQAGAVYNTELQGLTKGAVGTSNELGNLKAWLLARGVTGCESLTKDTLPEILKRTDLPPDARRALEIRQAMGSQSVKKCYALSYRMDAHARVRGLYKYCGAHTGRWAGMGPQPQNLPNSGVPVVRCLSCGTVRAKGLSPCNACIGRDSQPTSWGIDAIEAALPAIRSRSFDTLQALWGDPLKVISGCLRGFFIAAPGKELICSDFSSIEAVTIAELAGETWQQEVFRGHGQIYEMTASKITGLPFAEFERHKAATGSHHPQRKLGKVAVLASSFGGWVKAWIRFGAGEFLDTHGIVRNIIRWEKENPAIVKLWGGLYSASIAAIQAPSTTHTYRYISYVCSGDVLYCILPSGRAMPYHTPRIEEGFRNGQPSLTWSYMGVGDNTKWQRLDTWYGSHVENVTQAVARDLFAAALVRLERAGYSLVMHTHDEPCAEVPAGWGSVEEFEQIMEDRPAWAAGWPIRAAGGWRGQRYRKD